MGLILVTGASSGIGAAVARRMAADGHEVVLVARRKDALDRVAAGIGPRATAIACDAADGAAVLALAETVRRGRGVPDVVVNAAGAGRFKWVEDTTPAEAVEMMGAPYFAAFNLTHAFMRDMLARRQGVFIHVGSPASLVPWPSSAGYAAARWALRGLHEALDLDLRGTGVRTCHVVFGRVSSRYFEHNPGSEARLPRLGRMIRTVTPEECAGVIARLARRPRRQTFYPFALRAFAWSYTIAPGPVRWLCRNTEPRRASTDPGP